MLSHASPTKARPRARRDSGRDAFVSEGTFRGVARHFAASETAGNEGCPGRFALTVGWGRVVMGVATLGL